MDDDEILKQAKIIRRQRLLQRKSEINQKILKTIKEPTPLSSIKHRYPIILIDPPWKFENMGFNEQSPDNHYFTMKFENIVKLPISDITTENAIMFIWTTNAHLAKCLKLLEIWGFEYLSNLVWVKDKIALGYYFRTYHELLLLAHKGKLKIVPDPKNCPPSVLTTQRGKHSNKPIEVYEIIEKMYPELPKLELFARTSRLGWDVWGNQLPQSRLYHNK